MEFSEDLGEVCAFTGCVSHWFSGVLGIFLLVGVIFFGHWRILLGVEGFSGGFG